MMLCSRANIFGAGQLGGKVARFVDHDRKAGGTDTDRLTLECDMQDGDFKIGSFTVQAYILGFH
jgi:hypothetical protein